MAVERRKRKWLWLAAVAALVVCGLVLAVFYVGSAVRYAPGEATGDDLDIRLVGVWPEESADIRDPGGKIIDDTLGDGGWPERGSKSTMYRYRRFFLEMEDREEDVVFSIDITCSPTGKEDPRFSTNSHNNEDFPKGSRAFALRAWIPREYSTPRFPTNPFFARFLRGRFVSATKTHEVRNVDLTLRYYRGPSGQATYVFEGPFAAGGSVAAKEDSQTTLSVCEYYENGDIWGTSLQLTSGMNMPDGSALVVYDRRGKRLAVGYGSLVSGRSGRTLECRLDKMAPEGIGTVTMGEKTREKTFHNIAVAYGDAAEREYPEYIDEMAVRLGLEWEDWESVRSHRFDSGEDVLPVVDIIRGVNIVLAQDALTDLILGQSEHVLTADEKATLKEVFGKWAGARDKRIQAIGVWLGVMLDEEVFIDRALLMLEKSPPWARDVVTHVLRVIRWTCADAHIERVAGLIFESEAAHYVPCLALSIAKNESTAAREVLVRMVADDRPWLWWGALGLDAAKVALGDKSQWTREIVAREILVNGLQEEDAASNAEAFEEAQALLPTVITPDFALADEESFRQALGILIEKCDHEKATDVMIEFMSEARDYRQLWSCMLEMVSTINNWYGVDIGGIGGGVEDYRVMGTLNWRQIAMEAAEWRETGQVIAPIPPGYIASDGDIRVVLFDEKEPEKSLLSLWRSVRRPGVSGGVRLERGADRALVYTISSAGAGDEVAGSGAMTIKADYRMRYEIFWKEEKDKHWRQYYGYDVFSSVASMLRRDAEAPSWVPFKVVLEDATSEKSVLSGTKVFTDWWEKYGPKGDE